jgi:hypothetical protein
MVFLHDHFLESSVRRSAAKPAQQCGTVLPTRKKSYSHQIAFILCRHNHYLLSHQTAIFLLSSPPPALLLPLPSPRGQPCPQDCRRGGGSAYIMGSSLHQEGTTRRPLPCCHSLGTEWRLLLFHTQMTVLPKYSAR